MTNNQRNIMVVGGLVFSILALGCIVIKILMTVLSYENNTAKTEIISTEKTKTASPEKTEDDIYQQRAADEVQKQDSVEVERKILDEKLKIPKKLIEYENESITSWVEFIQALSANDIPNANKYIEITEKQIEEILDEISEAEWGNTGDEEFDKSCRELKEKAVEIYTIRYKSIAKLKVDLKKPDSPRKLNNMMKSVEELSSTWIDLENELGKFISSDK